MPNGIKPKKLGQPLRVVLIVLSSADHQRSELEWMSQDGAQTMSFDCVIYMDS